MIQEVVANGSAAIDGRLKAGDMILRLDDQDLRSASHQHAITALRQTSSVIQLLVFRDNDSANDQSEKLDVMNIELIRKSNKGLGLRISSGHSHGVYVADIIKGGTAASSGRITEGDQILEVDGKDLKNCSLMEATNILKV